MNLLVNGKTHEIEVASEAPLLWVLRDMLALTGTKFGCGMACVAPARCIWMEKPCARVKRRWIGRPTEDHNDRRLSADRSHPVQKAWIAEQVPQCGYCQSGQIMQAVAFLAKHPRPTNEEIDQTMSGNICRCGTYCRIRRAIQRAAKEVA